MFFELIRVGIGKQACLSRIPSGNEWDRLFLLAKMHAMVGICFAGLQHIVTDADEDLPKIGISEKLYIKWMRMTATIVRKNEMVNRQCADLQARLTEDDVLFCILKGQGAGLRYPSKIAMLRQSGDIDVWMAGGMESVVRYVKGIVPTDELTSTHLLFHVFETTEVEMHFVPVRLINRFANSRLKKWLKAQEKVQMKHQVPFGKDVLNVPTDEFDIVFLMLHIYKHMFNEGIGFRQLMDYYFLLTKSIDNAAKARARKVVSDLDLNNFASALMWVLQRVFGLDKSVMPWEPNQSDGEFLLEEIMQMGNFGRGDERFCNKKRSSHMMRFWESSKSKWRFIGHFPSEVIWHPIDMFLRFFEIRVLHKKAARFV